MLMFPELWYPPIRPHFRIPPMWHRQTGNTKLGSVCCELAFGESPRNDLLIKVLIYENWHRCLSLFFTAVQIWAHELVSSVFWNVCFKMLEKGKWSGQKSMSKWRTTAGKVTYINATQKTSQGLVGTQTPPHTHAHTVQRPRGLHPVNNFMPSWLIVKRRHGFVSVQEAASKRVKTGAEKQNTHDLFSTRKSSPSITHM